MTPWEQTWTTEEGDVINQSGDAVLDEAWDGPKDEVEAVARLAAAAPDLVRALLDLLNDVEIALADDPTDMTAQEQRCTIRNALRKAGVTLDD